MPPDQRPNPWLGKGNPKSPTSIALQPPQSRAFNNPRQFDGSTTIMLNAAAMKDLLSANVDENASHFA